MAGVIGWLTELGVGRELALWVAVSILLYVFPAQIAWRLHGQQKGALGERIRWLNDWRFRPLVWQLLRLSFYVIIPFGLLLRRRGLTGRIMGLDGGAAGGWLGWSAGEWLQGAGWAVLLVIGWLMVLGGSWWAVSRRMPAGSLFFLHHRPPAWELAWDAVFLQIHWAFYRGAASIWLGESVPYWGALLGLVLVGLEAAGDPSLFFDLDWPSLLNGWVRLASIAWLTAMLFVVTQNLWLGILVHWGGLWTINWWGGTLSRRGLATIAE